MTIRTLALAAALLLAIAPLTASADTLHGTPGRSRGRVQTVAVQRRGPVSHGVHTHRRHAPVRHVRRVHVHRHGACRFIQAHYTTRRVRVVVPGHHVERVIPARYEVHWRGHRFVHVQLEPRQVVRDWVPERVEFRSRRVWVRSRWVCS